MNTHVNDRCYRYGLLGRCDTHPRCRVMLWASLRVLAAIVAGILIGLAMGCSFSMTMGTGNRTASTFTTHSQIPETLKEIAPIAESASRGAVRGLNPVP